MAEMWHPHVVQFLGLCYLEGSALPVLVIERLDSSLDDLLETSPASHLPSNYPADRCGTAAALPAHPQPSCCTPWFISSECTAYIVTGGQDQWPWKCSYCWPAARPAGQDPLPCTRNISLYATWIVWWAFTIWSSAGYLLVWSPCTFHPHTGQRD